MPLVDRIAAEHVELALDDAEAFLPRIRNAGAIFIGRHTPEAIGDYVAGSNHVLPTARSARFSSGLSVLDFMKRTSILRLGPEQLRQLAPAAIDSGEGRRARRAWAFRGDPAQSVGHGMPESGREQARLIDIELDESIGRSTPDVEHERAVAIFDLIEENSFWPVNDTGTGPYRLKLSLAEQRLVFAISRQGGELVATHILSLTPFRRIVKDYYMICESYYAAIRTSTPSQIEAIDMGRRGLHNDGSQTLLDRLAGKIEIDFGTARRLFTLVCVLHWRGW